MKFEKVYLIYMGVVLIVLTILGTLIAGASRPLTEEEQKQADMVYEALDFDYPEVTAEHGPDGVIRWQDPGMEAHVRFLLNKPEGEIYRSEVWNVQVLGIVTAFQMKYDIMITDHQTDEGRMTRANTLNNTNLFHNCGNKSFPRIKSLEDLKYFESLQVFSLIMNSTQDNVLYGKGLDDCKNLKVVELRSAEMENVPQMNALEILSLQNCGSCHLEGLENSKHLRALSLIECTVESLEAVSENENLLFLNLLDTEIEKQETIPQVKILLR